MDLAECSADDASAAAAAAAASMEAESKGESAPKKEKKICLEWHKFCAHVIFGD